LFTQGLEEQARRCQPEFLLLSAGFDAHADDPIGSLGLTVEDFGTMTERLLAVARVHCGGRVVSLLEGGYHLQRLAECVTLHLEKLLADGSSAVDSPLPPAAEETA
jgi:acetoin utilization deacetylase AcuC-like enzyme